MFSIRQIYDDVLPVNKQAIGQVQEILRGHFSALPPDEIDSLAENLRNPFKQRFRSVLFVAEQQPGKVAGFGLLLHEPELKFCFLDFIAAARTMTGRGVGGALYLRVRKEAMHLGSEGLFLECLPDDPAECPDPTVLKDNIARMRFYERFGVRPIVNTAYEKPVRPEQRCLPHLMYDDLDRNAPLRRDFARGVVKAILERKYARLCPAEYVQEVVESIRDDPVCLRSPRYRSQPLPLAPPPLQNISAIPLVYNEQHFIHHV
nr:GNAT family N-acetyltransferase [Candidatus Anammoximicrobium sp.]